MIDYLHQFQWLEMIAAWLIASQNNRRRKFGFWCSLLSNSLWLVWGWHADAHALAFLQIVLAFLNIRGASKSGAEQRVKSEM